MIGARGLRVLTLIVFTFSSVKVYAFFFDGEKSIVEKNSLSGFIDHTGKLTIEQVVKSKDFRPVFSEVYNAGVVNKPVWLKFSANILDLQKGTDDFILQVWNSTIDHIDAFQVDEEGCITKLTLNREQIFSGYPTFNVSGFDRSTFYLRVQSHQTNYLPFGLSTYKRLANENFNFFLIQFFYLGIIVLILWYSCALAIHEREPAYIYYSLYIIAMTWGVCKVNGVSNFLVPEGLPNESHLPAAFTEFFFVLFGLEFLNSKQNQINPRIKRISLYAVSISSSAIIIFFFAGQKEIAGLITNVFALIIPVVQLAWGFYIYKRGYRPALYYILALLFFSAGMFVFILKELNWLPYSAYTHFSVQVGQVVEVVIFTYAFASRSRFYRQEKDKVLLREQALLEQNNKLTTQQKDQLRHKVAERTVELERMITMRDKLFSVLSHDLRGPMNSLSSYTYLLSNHRISKEEQDLLIKEIKSRINTVSQFMENLLSWTRAQIDSNGNNEKAQYFLKPFVQETIKLFEEVSGEKEVEVVEEIAESHSIYCCIDHLKFILRNILTNCIKFTPAKGRITISSKTIEPDYTEIIFADTGVGIGQETIKKIDEGKFAGTLLGTKGEKGTGLGLLMCKEFIHENHGQLLIEGHKDKGSVFRVRLRNSKAVCDSDHELSVSHTPGLSN